MRKLFSLLLLLTVLASLLGLNALAAYSARSFSNKNRSIAANDDAEKVGQFLVAFNGTYQQRIEFMT